MIEIKVPTVGESINEVTLVKWLKQDGAYVERDEVIAELESEKATFEVNAEQAGILKTVGAEGDTLKIGDTVAQIDETASRPEGAAPQPKAEEAPKQEAPQPAAPAPSNQPVTAIPNDVKASPVASAIIADKKVDPKSIQPSGYNGKILKEDVLGALANPGRKPGIDAFSREEKREKMSNLRKTVSRRLVEAKNTTAMLTTFNEVDMSRIMALRTQNKDKFKEKHGVNLGFMSFFTKAVCYALQEWPAVNAYIDGDSIVYHQY
ncbi:MAG TPA: 2-oxo acid dehydrogenase subunit E2, partial [Flavisolibacter sp.]|nr:2-oxo acid dehydrogenase subunit E2 [Flavisolibacter sp.]